MTSARLRAGHRVKVENEMIRRRERQFNYDQLWDKQQKYYQLNEQKNAKYEEWTSPRYHETNNKLVDEARKKKEHEENLTRRREKLRKLLMEEEKLYDVEMMIDKTKRWAAKSEPNGIPTEVLSELNLGLKLEEDDRRRHEAELKLYHRWRGNNPTLRCHERTYRCRDLKLSWLDQQIEKRMKKEKEEEESREILKQHVRTAEERKVVEEERRRELQAKREELKKGLDRQMEELATKKRLTEELRREEDEIRRKKLELAKIEDCRVEEVKRRLARECALFNVRQFRLKLKKKAEIIEETLQEERALITKLQESQLAELVENANKKEETKEAIVEFLKIIRQQESLEKSRRNLMDFLFDSEAQLQYEQQSQIWKQEEAARSSLIKEIISCLQQQIEENLQRNKTKLLEVLKEREETMKRVEEYNEEVEKFKMEEDELKSGRLREIEENVKVKKAKETMRINRKWREIDADLERVRKEEERLKKEIINMQRRQGPIRPARSRFQLY